ncbi:MAG TPA: hypothetical protein VF751_12600 [Chthoniobacterales bacterium]
MPDSSSPIGETDIGPLADSSSSTARKPLPDNVDPAIPENEEAAPEPSAATNGAEVPNLATTKQAQEPTAKTTPPLPPSGPPQQEQRGASPADWPRLDCGKSHQEMESTLYECMKNKYGIALVSDLDDAQQLLSYVTRNGLQEDRKIPADVIQTLITSREQMRAGTFNAIQDEAKFRASYGTIAKAAQPVTVASLRDSFAFRFYHRWFREPQSRPIAEIACLRYRNLAFFTLVALILIQSYWTATSSILGKTDTLIAETTRVRSDLAQQASRSAPVKTGGSSESAATSPSPANAPVEPPVSSDVEKTQATVEDLVSKNSELEANYSMLATLMWSFKWLASKPEEQGGTTSDAGQTQQVPKTAPGTQSSATPNPSTRKENNSASDSLFGPNPLQTRRASTRAIAGQVIDVMQKWLLPLLYGALGAMVFVVRTLSTQARDRLFRKEALVSLVLRVFLGMISGLAIGWFWTHDSTAATNAAGGPMSLSTLSPFALAFIAGYGVEVFFALLDKIVSTFTNKA